MNKILLLCSLLFLGYVSALKAQEKQPSDNAPWPFAEPGTDARGIFGLDNRYEIKDAYEFKDYARATAVLVQKDYVKGNRIYGYTLEEILRMRFNTDNISDRIRFLDQPAIGSCTGFLVTPNMLITAGHCFTELEDAKDYYWIFDYTSELFYNKKEKYITVPAENIYETSEIVTAKYDDNDSEEKVDYTVVRLDRPVLNRMPYRIRTSGDVSVPDLVYTIGSPTGLPLKFSDDARVVENTAEQWFKTDLDVFPGNSGGPVFNPNGYIEGILVRGATMKQYNTEEYSGDYLLDQNCNCVKPVQWFNARNNAGSAVQKITKLPYDILNQIVYENLNYALNYDLPDLFDSWMVYSWILDHESNVKSDLRLEFQAAKYGRPKMLEVMLSSGGNTIKERDMYQMYCHAIDGKHTEVIETLNDHYMFVDVKGNSGMTPFLYAVHQNNVDMIHEMLQYDSVLGITDVFGNNALHYAAANGNQDIVEYFIARGIKADVKNNQGYYPEKVAAKNKHKTIKKILKKYRKTKS